jgi:creatinine amidohydrolase/Fe(II)-dependent formamide hydrolase-like protein
VDMRKAPDAIPAHLKKMEATPFLGPLNFAWLTKDIAPEGVLGNAQTADPKRGEEYLAGAVKQTVELLRQIMDFRFD